jgi:hypothetical protein
LFYLACLLLSDLTTFLLPVKMLSHCLSLIPVEGIANVCKSFTIVNRFCLFSSPCSLPWICFDSVKWVCHLQLVHAPANVSAAPAQATPSKVAQPTGASTAADDGGIDSDLQARLDNLRKM